MLTPEEKEFLNYKREKIRMLTKDFKLPLKDNEIQHLRELQTEIQVDNYARDLINKY